MAASGAEARARAAAALADVSATPQLDAELLFAHAAGLSREAVLLADVPEPSGFADLIAQRRAGAPVAYLTGTRDFWTVTLTVGPGVLIPRPDSETLLDAAVAHWRGTPGPRTILDLGTGSGALLCAALDQWPDAVGVGIDASDAALAIARGNVARIAGARGRVERGGWAGTGSAHDLVLCNPPYVATGTPLPPDVIDWEPACALFAGADGLDDYRALAPLLPPQIAPGGVACIEIGHDQHDAAAALFRAAGLAVAGRRDLGGRDRCLVLTRN